MFGQKALDCFDSVLALISSERAVYLDFVYDVVRYHLVLRRFSNAIEDSTNAYDVPRLRFAKEYNLKYILH